MCILMLMLMLTLRIEPPLRNSSPENSAPFILTPRPSVYFEKCLPTYSVYVKAITVESINTTI